MFRISELPPFPEQKIDFQIDEDTQIAIKDPNNGCGYIFRCTVGDVLKRLKIDEGTRLYGFNKLTDTDRANLCDIAWFLKGLKAGEKSPFTDQDDSLEKAILAIGKVHISIARVMLPTSM